MACHALGGAGSLLSDPPPEFDFDSPSSASFDVTPSSVKSDASEAPLESSGLGSGDLDGEADIAWHKSGYNSDQV